MNRSLYLAAMGITEWHVRSKNSSVDSIQSNSETRNFTSGIEEPSETGSRGSSVQGRIHSVFRNATRETEPQAKISSDNWDVLEATAKQCTKCDLCNTRTHVVFGVGNRNADLLLIGEAPGANEDQQGEPFVGQAGQLLTKMLAAINLKREDVYIANVIKCRPPNNRTPLPKEVSICTPYLQRQIELIQPKLIVALGKVAAHFLLGSTAAMAQLRDKDFTYQNIPLLVTFHPAYLLRSPGEKAKAWQDLQKVQRLLNQITKA